MVDEQAHPSPRQPEHRGKDPDIEPDGIRFLPEDAAAAKGPFMRTFLRFQGWLFFPLLTLEGVNLHRTRWSPSSVAPVPSGHEGRVLEGTLLVARFAIYLTVAFWFLPFGMACAFLGVQLAVFGVMMGASFAPNHKGMPTIAHDAKVDFFSRQVRTSRNIRGGWWVSFLMGGLTSRSSTTCSPRCPGRRSGRRGSSCGTTATPWTCPTPRRRCCARTGSWSATSTASA